MNKLSLSNPLTTLTLSFSFTAAVLLASCGNTERTPADELAVSEAAVTTPPVAQIAANGTITINTAILKKTFPNGGEIAGFAVEDFADGPYLVRRGHTANGLKRSDTTALLQVGNQLYIKELTWMVICVGSCGGCNSNYQRTSCECANGNDCTFNENPLYVNEVIN